MSLTPPDAVERGAPAGVRSTRDPVDQASALRALVNAAGDGRTTSASPVRHAAVVAIASGKGGVGKTSISVNLSIAMSELGCRVTLVDADPGMANADVLCGLSPAKRLEAVVAGTGRAHRTMSQIALEAPGGFRLVPGAVGVARMAELGREDRAAILSGLAELERDSDVVVIDNGAGLGPSVLSFLNAADLSVIVATPEPPSIADAYALIKCLLAQQDADRFADRAHRGIAPARVPMPMTMLVNQAADAREAAAVHARVAAVCARFLSYPLPMLGSIAQDPRVALAVRERRPFMIGAPRTPASRDIRAAAGALVRQLRIDLRRETPPRRTNRWVSLAALFGQREG
jgi:flagellar biosynthesis protein FlhG